MFGFIKGVFVQAAAFAFASAFVVACSSSNDEGGFAGGTTEDAGIIADLNVAGVTQKGPFVKGSAVTVQGIDCKTMELTDEKFEGVVKSDKGDFEIKDVNLSSTCAVFEVTGYYLNEVTGKESSDKITLRTITNLKNRKIVNVNVLTDLECERVMNLSTKKETSFAAAKKQAEEEVLDAFSIKTNAGEVPEFENLNIFEKGDGNAALLAVSVLTLANAGETKLAERLDEYSAAIAANGSLDESSKAEIANWAATAAASGVLDTIRKNIESWGGTDEVPAFEKFVSAVMPDSIGNLRSSSSTPCKTDSTDTCEYGELTDERDGQVYKTVKIGSQEWMAENLNYKTDDSRCYNDSIENCAKYGRLYVWSEAMKVCPDGWRLPDTTEWNALLYGTVGDIAVVGIDAVGRNIRSKSGWLEQGTGGGDATDALGFSVLPGGSGDSSSYNGKGYNASFWTATSYNDLHGYDFGVGNRNAFGFSIENKGYFESVRCLKGKTIGVSSSSSSAVSSSSVTIPISALCKTEVVDACKYGTLIDDRDGQTYKTVKIGEQWWMAENLNYADSVKTPSLLGNSWCYNNNATMCDKYGRLYTWMAAIDSVKLATDSINPQNCGYNITCSLPAQAQGICPSGWHLPDTTDWKNLIETVGGWSNAGKALKSVTGWLYFESVDSYGFSALPGGFLYRSGTFDVEGSTAYLWVATENTSKAFYAYSIVLAGDGIDSFSDGFKDNAYSVRCIKD